MGFWIFMLISDLLIPFMMIAFGKICGVQLILLIGTIFPTEMALRKNFDENGKRR